MKWIWSPLMFGFALIDYSGSVYIHDMCVSHHGSSYLTSQMWFMWGVMGAMMINPYIEKLRKWL